MKNLPQNTRTKLDEIIFENRNKQYGAYVLRTESDKILMKAFFIGVSFLAAIAITPAVISAFKSSDPIVQDPSGGFVYTPVDLNPEIEEFLPVQQPIVAQVQTAKEFNNTVPTPIRNANESQIIKEIPTDATPGVTNNLTAPPIENTAYVPPTSNVGVATAPPKMVTPPVEKAPDNTINTVVDVEAMFVGGEAEFRKKIANNFDGSQFESEGILKTTLTFVVERDGSISNIKADGKDASFNAEALRTIKSLKGKWTPAKVKGESVRSYFKFPISMKFE